jgi:hypothetical protein
MYGIDKRNDGGAHYRLQVRPKVGRFTSPSTARGAREKRANISAHPMKLSHVLFALFVLCGSTAGADAQPADAPKSKEPTMWMTVGERRFAVALADTVAARAFAEQLPVTLDMDDLNANEKHVRLPNQLPAAASRPGTIRNGDVMLYGTNTLVIFYVTFESAYSYTRIGRVHDPAGLARALGPGVVRVGFSK